MRQNEELFTASNRRANDKCFLGVTLERYAFFTYGTCLIPEYLHINVFYS
jgi:hypothetical protein